MDLFEKYLNKTESKWVKIALTDSSYNFYKCKGVNKKDPDFIEKHTPLEHNQDLGLLGDTLIKFILTEYLYDKKTEKITKYKENFETDKYWIEKVAPKYNLIEKINRDITDEKIPTDYVYDENDCHKYIATTVEAMVAAMYKELEPIEKIKELVLSWISL